MCIYLVIKRFVNNEQLRINYYLLGGLVSVKDSKIKKIGNMELHDDENYVVISLNPDIYPLDIAYLACYIMLDRAFIVLDGDPKKEIIIELRPKDKTKKIDELGREFNNELINYAVYKIQAERNK